MSQLVHVALLIETSREYARGLLDGVARYHQDHGPWSIYFEPHGLDDPPPVWLRQWKGQGILARVNDQRMADAILATGLPAVDVRGALPDVALPFIGVDNGPVSQLAFEHLRDCGLRHFAFCGTPRGENPNQDRRCDFFVEQAQAAGHDCEVFEQRSRRAATLDWEKQQAQIARWLTRLPKPVGVMTCHDDRGHQVLDACRRAGLNVPDEVAVIGVDNDPHLTNLCTPPLSSVAIDSSQIGYRAATVLAEMMAGGKPPRDPVLVDAARGVAARQSSDMLAVADQELLAALELIRDAASSGLRVSDVVRRVGCSPSTLERKFKQMMGRTIKAEITRVRLNRARLLLSETDLSIAAIAEKAGFGEAKYFCEVFRKSEETTPTNYRARFRSSRG